MSRPATYQIGGVPETLRLELEPELEAPAVSSTPAPVGSRWYAWGHHYEVIEELEKDGEPAVRVRRIDRGDSPGRRPLRVPFFTARLVKYGTRHV